MTFKEGDWLYHNFKLKIVRKRSKYGMDVSDGYIVTCGIADEDCFPMSMEVKMISDIFEISRRQLDNTPSLNMPLVRGYFENHWIYACHNKDNPEITRKETDNILAFVREILEKVEEFKKTEIKGMRVFN